MKKVGLRHRMVGLLLLVVLMFSSCLTAAEDAGTQMPEWPEALTQMVEMYLQQLGGDAALEQRFMEKVLEWKDRGETINEAVLGEFVRELSFDGANMPPVAVLEPQAFEGQPDEPGIIRLSEEEKQQIDERNYMEAVMERRYLVEQGVIPEEEEETETPPTDRSFLQGLKEAANKFGQALQSFGSNRTPKNCAPMVAAGQYHTIYLKPDGTVWTWGKYNAGMDIPTIPTKIEGLQSIVQVASGQSFGLALKSDGTVWGWGNNLYGQLGNGTTTSQQTPVQVSGLNSVVSIAAGQSFSLALRSDGTVWSWGNNLYGQLGDGTTTNRLTPVQVKGPEGVGVLTSIKQVCAGNFHVFALKDDGTILSWGSNEGRCLGQFFTGTYESVPHPVLADRRRVSGELIEEPFEQAIAVAAGETCSFAIKSDGTVWTWGTGGDGGSEALSRPVSILCGDVALDQVQQLAVYGSTFIALKNDGTLWGWGQNVNGQLGRPYDKDESTAQVRQLGLSDAVSVACGERHTAVLKRDGSVWIAGSNENYQFGFGKPNQNTFPVLSDIPSGFTSLTSGGYLLKEDGTVWQVVDGNSSEDKLKKIDIENVVMVSTGSKFAAALKQDGTVWVWGSNENHLLGNATTDYYSDVPLQIQGLSNVIMIAAGYGYTIALKEDGTVWGWGQNYMGQLGTGSAGVTIDPTQAVGENGVGVLSNIVAIAAGSDHSLALDENGKLWAFGMNTHGSLGNGTSDSSDELPPNPIPAKVKAADGQSDLTGVDKIWAGNSTSYILKTDGTFWAWGYNYAGQLGDGTTEDRLLPTQILGANGEGYLSNIQDLAVSQNNGFALALKQDGTVLSWGNNTAGQLGDGTTENRAYPKKVRGVGGEEALSNIKQVVNLSTCSLAMDYNGRVYGWGAPNIIYTSGYETKIPEWRQVEGATCAISAVDSMLGTTLALSSDGTLWTAGANTWGELGIGTTVSSNMPVRVKNTDGTDLFRDAVAISSGAMHQLALKRDGTVWSWGNNTYGQLGDNTEVHRSTPVQVKGVGGEAYLSDIVAISAGDTHSLAIKSDGTVYAWGDDSYGILGDGTGQRQKTPVQVKGPGGEGLLQGAVSVQAGTFTSYALLQDGTVWGWGVNVVGNLGVGNNEDAPYPTQLKGLDGEGVLQGITAIDDGYALASDGTVYAWGPEQSGDAGDGQETRETTTPVHVKSPDGTGILDHITAIGDACALRDDGAVLIWGEGEYLPVVVPGEDGTGALTGMTHITRKIFRRGDATLWGIGKDSSGQFGLGTIGETYLNPVQIFTGGVVYDDYGNEITCAAMTYPNWQTRGKIDYDGDIDCFRFEIRYADVYQIHLDAELDVVVYGENGAVLHPVDPTLHTYSLAPGTEYTVSISGTTGSEYAFQVERSQYLTGPPQAPDITISYNGTYTEAVLYPGRTLTLESNLSPLPDLTITAFGADGAQIGEAVSSTAPVSYSVPTYLTGGSLRVTVASSSGQQLMRPFSLTEEPADLFGSTPETAQPMDTDKSVRGWLNTTDDVDVFSYTAPQDGLYVFATSGETDMVGKLYEPDNLSTPIAQNDNEGDNENFRLSATLTAGETYYLYVTGTETGDYSLKVLYEIGNIYGLVGPVSYFMDDASFNETVQMKATITSYESGEFIASMDMKEWSEEGEEYAPLSLSGIHAGDYLLELSRPGYLPLYQRISLQDNAVDIGTKTLLAGDVDDNGIIDANDRTALQDANGKSYGQDGYIVAADLNGDKTVNATDLALLNENIGKTSNDYGEDVNVITAEVTVNDHDAVVSGTAKPNSTLQLSIYQENVVFLQEEVAVSSSGAYSVTCPLKTGEYEIVITAENRSAEVHKTVQVDAYPQIQAAPSEVPPAPLLPNENAEVQLPQTPIFLPDDVTPPVEAPPAVVDPFTVQYVSDSSIQIILDEDYVFDTVRCALSKTMEQPVVHGEDVFDETGDSTMRIFEIDELEKDVLYAFSLLFTQDTLQIWYTGDIMITDVDDVTGAYPSRIVRRVIGAEDDPEATNFPEMTPAQEIPEEPICYTFYESQEAENWTQENDAISLAENSLGLPQTGYSIHGLCAAPNDADYYKMSFVEDGSINLWMDPAEGADIDLQLFDQEGELIGCSNRGQALPESIMSVPVRANIPYYLRVSGAGGENDMAAYEVEVSLYAVMDPYENNDAIYYATALLNGQTGLYENEIDDATIHAGTDVDYYKLILTGSDQYFLTVTFESPASLDFHMDILDNKGTPIAKQLTGGYSIEGVFRDSLASGTYYIRVKSGSGTKYSSSPYTISASAGEYREIDPSGYSTLGTMNQSNTAYYGFTAGTPSSLRAQLSNYGSGVYRIGLMTQIPNTLNWGEIARSISSGGGETFHLDASAVPAGQRFCYEVRRMSGNTSSYYFSVGPKPPEVVYDPLTPGSMQTVSEEKTFQVTVDYSGYYAFRTMRTLGTYDTVLDLYNSNMALLVSNDNYPANFATIPFNPYSVIETYLNAGTYYLRVREKSRGSVNCKVLMESITYSTISSSGNDKLYISNRYAGYYEFTPQTTGTYVFKTEAYSGQNCDTNISIYGQKTEREVGDLEVWDDDGMPGAYSLLETTMNAHQTYYILVSNRAYVSGNDGKTTCSLTVSKKTSGSVTPPEVDKRPSVSITSPQNGSTHKLYRGDRIPITGTLQNVSALTVTVNGYTANVTRTQTGFSTYTTPPTTGTYTIVATATGIYGGTATATCTIEVFANDDGDDFSVATDIRSGTNRAGSIEVAEDSDFFKIHPEEARTYGITLFTEDNLVIGLFDKNHQIVDRKEGTGTLELTKLFQPENGPYYIKIRHSSDTGTGYYRLLVMSFRNELVLDNNFDGATQGGGFETKDYSLNKLIPAGKMIVASIEPHPRKNEAGETVIDNASDAFEALALLDSNDQPAPMYGGWFTTRRITYFRTDHADYYKIRVTPKILDITYTLHVYTMDALNLQPLEAPTLDESERASTTSRNYVMDSKPEILGGNAARTAILERFGENNVVQPSRLRAASNAANGNDVVPEETAAALTAYCNAQKLTPEQYALVDEFFESPLGAGIDQRAMNQDDLRQLGDYGRYLLKSAVNGRANLYFEHTSEFLEDMYFGVLLHNTSGAPLNIRVYRRGYADQIIEFDQSALTQPWEDYFNGTIKPDESGINDSSTVTLANGEAKWICLFRLCEGAWSREDVFNGVINFSCETENGSLYTGTDLMAYSYIMTNYNNMPQQVLNQQMNNPGGLKRAYTNSGNTTDNHCGSGEGPYQYQANGITDVRGKRYSVLLGGYDMVQANGEPQYLRFDGNECQGNVPPENDQTHIGGYDVLRADYGVVYRFDFQGFLSDTGGVKVKLRYNLLNNANITEFEHGGLNMVLCIQQGSNKWVYPYQIKGFETGNEITVPQTIDPNAPVTVYVVYSGNTSFPGEVSFESA